MGNKTNLLRTTLISILLGISTQSPLKSQINRSDFEAKRALIEKESGLQLSDGEVDKQGIVQFARFKTDSAPPRLSDAQTVLKKLLPVRTSDKLRPTETIQDSSGKYTNQIYRQYYKDIRVDGGVYNLSAKNGNIRSAVGTFHSIGEVNTTPQLTEAQALQCAMKHIGAKLYAWQDSLWEEKAHEHWGISYYPQGELVIAKDRLKADTLL